MERARNDQESNRGIAIGDMSNSQVLTLSISKDAIPLADSQPEGAKKKNSFQRKKKEQMRSRIKDSLFSSSSKNASLTSSSCENLIDTQDSQTSLLHVSLPIIGYSTPLLSEDNLLTPRLQAAPGMESPPLLKQKEIFVRFKSSENTEQVESDLKQGIFKISGNFSEFYELKETLGEGCVGLVKKAVRKSDQKIFAVKTVRTRDEETIQNIKFEFIHLKELDHPNIVKVYELYVDSLSGKIHSVMELIQGKEMFEVIHELGHYSELVASRIFVQILDAIVYMHEHYCCHRDLKPNNILCNDDGTQVKITDFNVSKFSDHYKNYLGGGENILHQCIRMWTYTGTMAFSAPEVFNGDWYDESIDMWSAGCILFTMLSGCEPFQAEYVNDLVNQICQGKYSFDDPVWNEISSEAKDIISRCLTVDSSLRIKPQEGLRHPFISRVKTTATNGNGTVSTNGTGKEMAKKNVETALRLDQVTDLTLSIDVEKELEESLSDVKLCRRQLSSNIDRLIMNNSKKNERKSQDDLERPRSVSSLCLIGTQLEEGEDQELSVSKGLKEKHDSEIERIDTSHKKRKKKYSIIFSKQDCFSHGIDHHPIQPYGEDFFQQQMTTSSSPTSSVRSSLSPTLRHRSHPIQNIYWDDNQSSLYSVTSYKNKTEDTPAKDKSNESHPYESSEEYCVKGQLTPNLQGQFSEIKKMVHSFKQRFIFSQSHQNYAQSQRSFSCDIQNAFEFQRLQEKAFERILQLKQQGQLTQQAIHDGLQPSEPTQ